MVVILLCKNHKVICWWGYTFNIDIIDHYFQRLGRIRIDMIVSIDKTMMTEGGKGECVLFQNQWLTPNQFEKLAGLLSHRLCYTA